MVEFNLLPWRTYTRCYQDKSVKKLLIKACCVQLAIVLSLYAVFNQRENKLTEKLIELRHAVAQNESPAFTQIAKQLHHSAQLQAAVPLQQEATRKLLQAVVAIKPTKACVSSIKREKNQVTVTGFSASPLDFTDFVLALSAAAHFSNVTIDTLTRRENQQVQFRFHAEENLAAKRQNQQSSSL